MSIPANVNPLLLAADAAAAGGFQVSRSLRYNGPDSSYCGRVFPSAGNRTTWTFSAWIKRSQLGVLQRFFSGATATNDNDWMAFLFNSSDQLVIGGYNVYFRTSNSVYRDCSAWYHLVITANLGSGTDALKLRAWINNTEVTWTSTSTNPTTTGINSANNHAIGAEQSPNNGGVGSYFNGYLANIHFIDGQALTPASFAETDATTGQWIPKAFSGGSYGTNGFYLKFDDNSSNTASTLGKDYSGLGNNWTPNNFSVTSGGKYARYVYAGNATYNGSETGTSYYTGAGSQYNGFDGNTSTYVGGQNIGASWVYFRPGTAISGVSQVRVYTAYVEQIYINGSLVSLSPSAPSVTAQWYSVTSPSSTINEIAIQGRVADNSAGRFSAIEVNGVVLIDNLFGSGNDSLIDSPTNGSQSDTGVGGEVRGNYATLNPLSTSSSSTLSNGNLELTSSGQCYGLATIAPTSGKWYWELTVGTVVSNSFVGLYSNDNKGNVYLLYGFNGFGFTSYGFGSPTSTVSGTASAGDVIGFAFNIDTSTITLYKNGSSLGTITGITLPGNWSMGMSANASISSPWIANFGQRAFAYTAPSGFKALCTQNLPAPLVTKSNTAMDVVTYTGNGSTQSITGLGFSPDFAWFKRRDSANNHALFDIVRGSGKFLISSDTGGEGTDSNSLISFDTSGFTIGQSVSAPSFNISSGSYVAWSWDAGTSTVSNTQGSITSQVRANATAGFSVVTYTVGSNTSQTMGHGLGVAPQLIIVKERNQSNNWFVYHNSIGNGNYLSLNTTTASTASNLWNSTSPTSTVFTIRSGGSSPTYDGRDHVAYCFTPVVGYSNFGSYTGNGSTDGPFVYTGMRCRWIMIKRTDTGGSANYDWMIYDTARDTYNLSTKKLTPNSSVLEGQDSDGAATDKYLDILSNGFKIKVANAGINGSPGTFIYAAFAEMPFNYSRAR